jgi:putative acyl-CoA dehydrogenase
MSARPLTSLNAIIRSESNAGTQDLVMPQNPKSPEPLEDSNLLTSNTALSEAVGREGASAALKRLSGFGLMMGSSGTFALAQRAARNRPALESFDRNGQPLNRIAYDLAFLELIERSAAEGLRRPTAPEPINALAKPLSGLARAGEPNRLGSNVERAAQIYMAVQADAGHVRCLTMAHAALALIDQAPSIAEIWSAKIGSQTFDHHDAPADTKTALTASLSLSTTGRVPDLAISPLAANPGETVSVSGLIAHTWMPDADVVIALVQRGRETVAILIPRFRANGRLNAFAIRPLNDTLGLASAANAAVLFDGAEGVVLDTGEGLRTAVARQRLDGATAMAGLMHRALAEAISINQFDIANGMGLGQKTLVLQSLADMALDAEASVALVFRLARAFDRSSDKRAAAWRRLMTPVTAYFVAKCSASLVAEASEAFGGLAGSEAWPMARLYRDALPAQWIDETANALTLDVLHGLQREPDVMDTVMTDLADAAASDPRLTTALARIEALLQEPRYLDGRGRNLIESLGTLAAAVLLKAHAPMVVSEAYIANRLASGPPRRSYGLGLDWSDNEAIVSRALKQSN